MAFLKGAQAGQQNSLVSEYKRLYSNHDMSALCSLLLGSFLLVNYIVQLDWLPTSISHSIKRRIYSEVPILKASSAASVLQSGHLQFQGNLQIPNSNDELHITTPCLQKKNINLAQFGVQKKMYSLIKFEESFFMYFKLQCNAFMRQVLGTGAILFQASQCYNSLLQQQLNKFLFKANYIPSNMLRVLEIYKKYEIMCDHVVT